MEDEQKGEDSPLDKGNDEDRICPFLKSGSGKQSDVETQKGHLGHGHGHGVDDSSNVEDLR